MGATLTDMSNVARILGRHCASTGVILAMHVEQLFVLLKHGDTPALRQVVHDLVAEQLLIGNANSEVGLGGDVMRSNACLEPDGDGWRFDKQALAASFCQEADLVLSTSRRSPDAADTDQVVALFRGSEFSLEQTSGWDTLGLRGTCSSGLHIQGRVTQDNLFPVPFSVVANTGGGQLRHVLLTGVWTGIAEACMQDAHKTVRAQARRDIGTTPQSAVRLAEILADVQVARSTLAEALRAVEKAVATDSLDDIGVVMTLRNVKVVTSSVAVRTATSALQICGITGFRRGPDHRLERMLRDAHGGLIMVSNDRYLLENAQMIPVRKGI